ncbi:MAG: DMT family transporter [Mangrovibacterium sp.]
MNKDRIKGYLFAVIATVTFSNIYIFSKAALNEVHLVQFGLYWFFIALLLNGAWLLKSGHGKQLFSLSGKQYRILAILGILEILTTTSFFLSIKIIPDPAVTSFLGNFYPVILTGMGILFLNERFSWLEGMGGLFALAGAFIISYQGGTSLADLFIPGTGVVLINAIFASVASMVVKVNVRNMSPELMNTNRSLWLFVYALIAILVSGQPLEISGPALLNIALGATLGDFIGILTIYYSFRYIEVSKSSIVQSLKGIFVLAGSYLYFKTLPLEHQLAGGFLTVVGVLLISVAKTRLFARK